MATGLRILGVSLHFWARHDVGRDYLQQSLDWYEHGELSHSFRFGLDQESAGQAFLSRLLWLQGEYKAAKQMAWRGVKKAARLQHVCSLCCALAEGACMTAALDRNPRWVIKAANWLIHLAKGMIYISGRHTASCFLFGPNSSVIPMLVKPHCLARCGRWD